MSIEMVYIVDEAEFSMVLRDDEVLKRLARRCPRECEVVFGVEEPEDLSFQAPRGLVARTELLAAVDRLLFAFKEAPELRPRRYVFDFDIIPGVPVSGDTEVLGVQLPGKEGQYRLFGGVGQCVLRRYEVGPDGLSVYKEALDVSSQTVLETESHGPIRIRSTTKRSPIPADLKRLRRFLETQSGEMVTKELR